MVKLSNVLVLYFLIQTNQVNKSKLPRITFSLIADKDIAQ